MKRQASIERQLLMFLEENPAAQDTLRGITEWWLLKQQIAQSAAQVEAAVDALIAKGKLTVLTGIDGTVHYRVRKDAITD